MRSVNDEIVCPVCGQSFIFKGGRRKYCSPVCSRTAELERKRVGSAKVKPKAKAVSPLSMIAREASEAGMTYGRYVARKAACAPSGGFSWKHTTAFGKRGTERLTFNYEVRK